ncbi:hypothetical protein JRO89_XS14G0056800 [Xanthoceras sorbifolium]|uniref:DUF674 domain-containing protein n=1 Tax=Xanthoceras sorbifolium TaxID=99658 RepID=A0ABQ8H408_9ROSI|nr:hypothetical protein JRO89_XS14G0056800 [Xanthoceras sorbifolium]
MSTASTVKLKLLIDKKGNKVLFAEASKDFVDFLFYLLSLPVGTVVKLLKEKSLVGALGKLYESIENLHETYIQPNQNKNTLLNPRSSLWATEVPFCCLIMKNRAPERVAMNIETSIIVKSAAANAGAVVEGGFVKGVVTYMVMDDLEVKPVSTITSITMLNKFNVKDVGALEERVVDIGINEGLKLLKASLECKNVMTSVFLGNKL